MDAKAVPCDRCFGVGRVHLLSWLVRDFAPVWLASLSVTFFILQSIPGEMNGMAAGLLLAGVGTAGLWMLAVIEAGAGSFVLRFVDLYRWIFIGRVPVCPRCGGRGECVPRPDRSIMEVVRILLMMMLVLCLFALLGSALVGRIR